MCHEIGTYSAASMIC